jgi:hypothetical protein
MDKLMIEPAAEIIQNPLISDSINTQYIPIENGQTDILPPYFSPFVSYFFIFGIIGVILFLIFYNKTNKRPKNKNIKAASYLDKYKAPTKEFLRNTTDKIKSWKEDLVQWFQGFFYKMRVKNKTFSTYRKKRKT